MRKENRLYKKYYLAWQQKLKNQLVDVEKKDLREFFSDLDKKLLKGQKEHGDRSFSFPLEKILAEIKLECLDLAGWGLMYFHQLQEIKNTRPLTEQEKEQEKFFVEFGLKGIQGFLALKEAKNQFIKKRD